MTEKIFYTISEVAKKVGVSTQTIRNWQSDFPQVKVKTNASGRRFFTAKNIEILRKIKKFREAGYTVTAVRKMFSKKVDKNIENLIIKIDSMISRIDKLL